MASEREKYALGAISGAVAGGSASAATGFALNKTVAAIANTSMAKSLGATVTKSAPRLVRALPVVGTAVGLGVAAYSIYEAVKPAVARAQEAGKAKARQNKELPPPADADTNVQYQMDAAKYARERAKNAEPGSQDARIWDQRAKAYEARARELTPSSAPAAKPAERSLWEDIKSTFSSKPDPQFEERRKALQSTRKLLEKNLEQEQKSGFGPRSEAAKRALDDNERQMKELAREESDANPFRQGFQTAAPIGAAIAGLALGQTGFVSGASKLKKGAEATAGEVAKLGRKADAILKARPNSIIAGTPIGDKGKGIVNEAYARAGAHPAFPSPGYPASKAPAQQVFASSGRAKAIDYIPAGVSAAEAVAATTASVFDDNPNRRMGERVLGAFAGGMAFGQLKTIAGARNIRPPGNAVASIEGLRNRIARETATNAPAGVAATKAAANAALARTAARRATGTASARASAAVAGEGIRGQGRVAAARMMAQQPAIAAGTKAAVAKARGAAAVERAQIVGKAGNARAIAKANVDVRYKDTWQDSRGRIYHRKDQSVRKRKDTPAANDNLYSIVKAR